MSLRSVTIERRIAMVLGFPRTIIASVLNIARPAMSVKTETVMARETLKARKAVQPRLLAHLCRAPRCGAALPAFAPHPSPPGPCRRG